VHLVAAVVEPFDRCAVARGQFVGLRRARLDAAVQLGPAAPYGQRSVLAEGSARVVPVWRRGDLRAGHTLTGPGLVDQDDTTVFVAAGWVGTVRESGNLLLQRGA